MQTTIPQSLYSAMRFNFLYVDKYTFHSGWFFPEDYIPYCLLRFITRGEAVFKINSEEIAVHKMRSFTYRKERLCRAGR